jgi:serine phosphatase RsbU (regulator of sigma subunit)
MFGWEISVIICFLYFSTRYNRIAQRLEYLNRNLKEEVQVQTNKLVEANHKLEHERDIANKDMHMAALVQQKFFHAPDIKFKNWDYAVCYEPLSDVSGDLFNFYYDDNKLTGISIFDASGHGVAASLVTMLAENVIRHVYNENKKTHKRLSEVLEDLNTNLIEAKGDVDNFLTGILLNINEKKNGDCTIDIADAAHPYPLLYRKELNQVVEIQPPVGVEAYGPIGIADIETKYADFSFDMEKGDILVLFTDGLPETMNELRKEFGKEGIGRVLNENNKKSAQIIMQSLLSSLEDHAHHELMTDDVTVIILKRK